jgi:hypothetical protein
MQQVQGFRCKICGFIKISKSSCNRKIRGSSPQCDGLATRPDPWWTNERHGQCARWCFTGARVLKVTGARRRWLRRTRRTRRCQRGAHHSTSSDTTTLKSGDGLSLAREQRRVRESSEARGRGAGCSRGWNSPFIGVGGALGRWQQVVTVGVMALTPLMVWVV